MVDVKSEQKKTKDIAASRIFRVDAKEGHFIWTLLGRTVEYGQNHCD